MNFQDFRDNPSDLIGKIILHEYGTTYGSTNSKYIRKITKVTKTGFKIEGNESLFDINDGRQKGLSGRMNMGSVSKCSLITEEEANEYRDKWRIAKEERALREEIKSKIEALSVEKLRKIKEIIQ